MQIDTVPAASPVLCVTRWGTVHVYLHPEGECACFRGGPAPIQQPTALDALLAAARCLTA